MLREPVRRDRIVTILPSGKVRPIPILRPPDSFPHVGRKRISKADAAEHDTGDWEVGAKYYESQSRSQFKPVFFSPGGRIYVTMNNALARLLDEFVRALLPRSTSRRAGRPVGSTPLRVRTVFFFEAVMFLLH